MLELMCFVCVHTLWRDHFNCFLIPAESTSNTYCLINNHWIKGLLLFVYTLEVCTGSKLKPEPGPYPRLSDPTRPDPSGTVKFRARTRPEIPPPPTNSQQKKKEKGCISRLHAKKRINQGSAISQTFTSYESL